jgi:four helix bundle protein
MPHITTYKELRVYQAAVTAAVRIFELTRLFPPEERYSMTDQMRRASRSVCANLGEAWRRRRYKKSFINKLNECESEAEETRVWIELSWRCGYLSQQQALELDRDYDRIIGQLVRMVDTASLWVVPPKK